MNIKTSALITALTLTASASFAASSNNIQDDFYDAKAQAKALSAQLETMGVESNPNVEFAQPTTLSQKLNAYEAKIDELQGQFDAVRASN